MNPFFRGGGFPNEGDNNENGKVSHIWSLHFLPGIGWPKLGLAEELTDNQSEALCELFSLFCT